MDQMIQTDKSINKSIIQLILVRWSKIMLYNEKHVYDFFNAQHHFREREKPKKKNKENFHE